VFKIVYDDCFYTGKDKTYYRIYGIIFIRKLRSKLYDYVTYYLIYLPHRIERKKPYRVLNLI